MQTGFNLGKLNKQISPEIKLYCIPTETKCRHAQRTLWFPDSNFEHRTLGAPLQGWCYAKRDIFISQNCCFLSIAKQGEANSLFSDPHLLLRVKSKVRKIRRKAGKKLTRRCL